MSTHTGNVLKVVELSIEDRVYNAMKRPKFSVEALTRELNADGIAITAQSIRKFIKKSKKAQREVIAKDLQVASQYKKLALDYEKKIKDILTEVEEVKNEAKDTKDFATYNQLIGRLMQGLELIAKLTGDIKPQGSVDIKIIYNEINADVEKEMVKMNRDLFKGKTVDVDAEIEEADLEAEKSLKR